MDQADGVEVYNNAPIRTGNRQFGIMGFAMLDLPLEFVRPKPDIQALFKRYNERYFMRSLGGVKLEWTKKLMTNGAVCVFRKRKCTIKLSSPLSKLRTRKELIDTLLHQMIHAYMFLRTRDTKLQHNTKFCKLVEKINKRAGCKMTGIYDAKCETDVFDSHWWRCDGHCKRWPKRFGYVTRKENIAPGPQDSWWKRHQNRCGGRFRKVQEPIPRPKPDSTAVGSAASLQTTGNCGEVSMANQSADIPVNEATQNGNLMMESSINLPINNVSLTTKEDNEEPNKVFQNRVDNKQQNASVASTSGNNQKSDKKKNKKKKSSQVKKNRSKQLQGPVTKRDKVKHSTLVGEQAKKKQKTTNAVKGNNGNNQCTNVVKEERPENMEVDEVREKKYIVRLRRTDAPKPRVTTDDSTVTSSCVVDSSTDIVGNGSANNSTNVAHCNDTLNINGTELQNNFILMLSENINHLSQLFNIQNMNNTSLGSHTCTHLSSIITQSNETVNHSLTAEQSPANEIGTLVHQESTSMPTQPQSLAPLAKKAKTDCDHTNIFSADNVIQVKNEGNATNDDTDDSEDI